MGCHTACFASRSGTKASASVHSIKNHRTMKSLLKFPPIYMAIQAAIGAKKARKTCIDEFAKPRPGMRVLDVGCGPGFVVEYLPNVQYVGTDIDQKYIEHAKKRYGHLGEYHCMQLDAKNMGSLGKFDVVLLNGVLHHIDDQGVLELLSLIRGCLTESGRLMTLDGCFYESMSWISRYLIRNDRGQFVRQQADYLNLANQVFPSVEFYHRTDLFSIPYDALVMVCSPTVVNTTPDSA
jgi:SAM-dependent methyltransferase